MGRLQGKVAIVTGAGQGIGEAVARAFGEEGATVVVAEVHADAAERTAKEIEAAGGKAMVLPLDVSDRVAVDEAVARVAAQHGGIDVLVNNAGITRPAMLLKMTDDEWQAVVDVNLSGIFFTTRAVARAMVEAGRGGRIINVTSGSGIQGTVGQINYAAAKAGVIGITKAAARELGRYGILVNAVAPAAATPMNQKLRTDPKFEGRRLSDRNLLARYAEPSEIARYFVFLAGDEQTYMTGQVINVDGGLVV